jgi:hypothetical protein
MAMEHKPDPSAEGIVNREPLPPVPLLATVCPHCGKQNPSLCLVCPHCRKPIQEFRLTLLINRLVFATAAHAIGPLKALLALFGIWSTGGFLARGIEALLPTEAKGVGLSLIVAVGWYVLLGWGLIAANNRARKKGRPAIYATVLAGAGVVSAILFLILKWRTNWFG